MVIINKNDLILFRKKKIVNIIIKKGVFFLLIGLQFYFF
jgi:hypothetical protein